MEFEKFLMISVIIFAVFAMVLGIINAIAYGSATDGSCNSITKAWAETMLIINIVGIFLAVIVIALVCYQLFKHTGREDVTAQAAKKKTTKQPVEKKTSFEYGAETIPIPKTETASTIYNRPEETRRLLNAAFAAED